MGAAPFAPHPYQLIRSKRRTCVMQMRPDGSVVVRAPMRMPNRQIQAFVALHGDWIARMRAKMQQAAADGQSVLTGDEIAALRAQAAADFAARVRTFGAQMGISVNRIAIRCQKSRWGSCSSAGNLNFNLLLMLAPPFVRDYVVVHELCHRREMNHSPRFWSLVAQVLPEYQTAVQWLRDNGAALMARRPMTL